MHYFYRSGMALAATAIGSLTFQAMFQGADAAPRVPDSVEIVGSRDTPNKQKRVNAWDDTLPDNCAFGIASYTTGDAQVCEASITCDTPTFGNPKPPDASFKLDLCQVGYVQYFFSEYTGNISIQFAEFGNLGSPKLGLHKPIVAMQALFDWAPFDVEDQIAAQDSGKWGKGRLCSMSGDETHADYSWVCGFPRLRRAANSFFGVNLMNQDSDKATYTPGWCTAHVTQYQRNEYGNGDYYAFAVQIFDGAGDQIGHVAKAPVDATGHLSVNSKLPYTLVLDTGPNDDAPVQFAYSDQSWTCDGSKEASKSGHLCTLGTGKVHGFENGDRSGDMGFSC
ncbi:hypothetical protein GGR54DRAFT_438991 [Hypoxylon sp. NC1633]|nr:hypothetical protein GGR54DRAFT_438991 [Hypoxylon sp. NC1633]